MWVIQLIFINLYLGYIVAFTKDLRIFGVDVDRSNDSIIRVYFDRTITSVEKECNSVCEKLLCQSPSNGTSLAAAVKILIDGGASTNLLIIIRDYYDRSEHRIRSKWLEQSDEVTRTKSLDSQLEVEALKYGRIRPRESCVSEGTAISKGRRGCLLADLFPEDELKGTDRLKPVEYWLTAAESLFNGHYYDHAEAVAYFLVKKMSSLDLKANDNYNYVRALMMLTEIAKEKGHLRDAVHFSLHVIDSCSLSPVTGALHRLRLLLTVPPIPPPSNISQFHRSQMLLDLSALLGSIKDESLTLSIKELSSGVTSTTFHIAHQGLNDRDIQIQLSAIYSTLCPTLLFMAPFLCEKTLIASEVEMNGNVENLINSTDDIEREFLSKPDLRSILKPIKIGFISTNFFDHSIGRMLVELFVVMHEKSKGEKSEAEVIKRPVEIIVYYVDKNINLTVEEEEVYTSGEVRYNSTGINFKSDMISDILLDRLGPSHFRRYPAFLPLLQHDISYEELDFLMFTDLGMDFITYALAHSRLAGYQAAWWGHPITSGLHTIDYFFGLDIEIPTAGEQHYSEQLIRMQYMNSAPIRPIDTANRLDRDTVLQSAPIASDSKICMVLGRLFKLHPDFDETLANILIHSPDNTVLVLVAEIIEEWNVVIYDRILDALIFLLESGTLENQFEKNPISGDFDPKNAIELDKSLIAADIIKKLRFVSYDRYSDMLLLSTVILDTYPYGGCLTAHDALSNAVPMVTLPLEHVRGRYTLGMYEQMVINDLIATNPADYVALVLRLLTDENYWREKHEKIRYTYDMNLHRNSFVADEWLGFIRKIVNAK